MKESIILKLIESATSPVGQQVQSVIEKSGKTSAVVGGASYVAEQLSEPSTLPQIAAIVSIVGGVVWVASIVFNMFITWLKYKRGDKE